MTDTRESQPDGDGLEFKHYSSLHFLLPPISSYQSFFFFAKQAKQMLMRDAYLHENKLGNSIFSGTQLLIQIIEHST